MTEKDDIEKERNWEESEEVSLAPLYSPLDVSKGLQAYRRGEAILYTVRGEPAKVQELIDALDDQGVNEVVALVSHRQDDKAVEEIADAVVKPSEKENDEEEPE